MSSIIQCDFFKACAKFFKLAQTKPEEFEKTLFEGLQVDVPSKDGMEVSFNYTPKDSSEVVEMTLIISEKDIKAIGKLPSNHPNINPKTGKVCFGQHSLQGKSIRLRLEMYLALIEGPNPDDPVNASYDRTKDIWSRTKTEDDIVVAEIQVLRRANSF